MHKLLMAGALGLPILLAAASFAHAAGSAKTSRSLLSDEEIAIARENIAKYDWAKATLNGLKHDELRGVWCGVGKSAEDLLSVPDEQLWELMPDTRIRRDYYVNQHKGCPVHGVAIKKFHVFHPWKIDPFNKPFKIQCPVGGEWYPSNDFAKGDLTSGDFADGGLGWKRGEDTFYFIGEYIHAVYLDGVRPALDRLAQLYILTGDRRYAHKAAVILLRLAEQFPNSTDKKDRCYKGTYAAKSGLITDFIWSCGDVGGIAEQYDKVFDALGDPETLAFAGKKVPGIKTGADFREYVEENIVRVGARALIDQAAIGNFGFHHQAGAAIALVMDDARGANHPDSRELMDWLYYKADGPLRTFARNTLLKDGGSSESTGYNTSRLYLFAIMDKVEKLRGRHPEAFPVSRYPNLWGEPKIQAMTDYFTDLVLLDRYTPAIGDSSGEPLKPGDRARGLKSMLGTYNGEVCFRQYGEDRFARMMADASGKIAHTSLFERPVDEQVRAAVKKLGDFAKRGTTLLDGYQVAIARSGEEENQRAAWLFYGATRSHAHHDALNLGFDAKGMALIPELGYPKSWDFAYTWETHILTHNTVMVDRINPRVHDIGRLVALQSSPGIELIDAESDPYRAEAQPVGEPGRLYRRTSMLVDLSPEDCYLADIFRAQGGSEHWQSWHGPAVVPVYEGPALAAQAKGTLAGENAEYNTPRPGADGKPILDVFAMLNNVRRGEAGPWSLDYPCGGKGDVHIRVNGLPEPGTELVLADGRAPSDPNDYTVRYAFSRRTGDAGLRSQYLSVLEPYAGKRVVDGIESLSPSGKAISGFRPAGIRVTSGAMEDTILSTGTAGGTARLGKDFSLKGDTGLVRRRGGKLERLFLSGGTLISAGESSLSLARAETAGEIVALDRDANEITVSMRTGYPGALVGRRIRVHSEMRSAAYVIVSAAEAGTGRVRLKLNTTSLLAEGVADGFRDGIIDNSVWMDYAGVKLVDGKWNNACSVYHGATIENAAGTTALRIEGVATGKGPYVVLAEKDRLSAGELAKHFSDTDRDGRKVFHLYDYGLGDRVTLPNLASLRATGEGSFSLEATDDVVLSMAGGKVLVRPVGGEEWTACAGRVPLSVSRGKAEVRVER